MTKEIASLGNTRVVSALAPASVGNVAVGFDVMGHAIQGVGDTVTVERCDEPGISVVEVTGCVTDLPLEAERNTAAAAIQAMAVALGLEAGFQIRIHKGIPLGSGLGGSAASAVGAVVAVNQMLKIPLPLRDLYPWALAGELIASGELHGDNVAPSLIGGLAVIGPHQKQRPVAIPAPNRLRCVVIHPQTRIDTRDARASLPKTHSRELVVAQMANMAAFLAGCHARDMELIGDSLRDLLIEPKRAASIPGFRDVKRAAMAHGALGCSISGSGPSVFAWFQSDAAANEGADAMAVAFAAVGLASTCYSTPVVGPGARVVQPA